MMFITSLDQMIGYVGSLVAERRYLANWIYNLFFYFNESKYRWGSRVHI